MDFLWLFMALIQCFDIQNIDEQNACTDYYIEQVLEFDENFTY